MVPSLNCLHSGHNSEMGKAGKVTYNADGQQMPVKEKFEPVEDDSNRSPRRNGQEEIVKLQDHDKIVLEKPVN